MTMHIFLVGMPGTGKSSLGRQAANELHLPFVDTDVLVSNMMGMEIHQMVNSLGEEFYHNTEAGVLISLVGEAPGIVSTGSGIVFHQDNVQLMQNHGVIIHVQRPLDQLLADAKVRQAAGKKGPEAEDLILEYNQRIGFYRACADYTLDNELGMSAGIQALIGLIEQIRQPAFSILEQYPVAGDALRFLPG